MLVLSWVPLLGPLMAGMIAGLAAQRGIGKGALAGGLAGGIAGLLIGGFLLFLFQLFSHFWPPHLWGNLWDTPVRVTMHLVSGLLIVLHCGYFVCLGALGGCLGGALVRPKASQAPGSL